MFKIAIDEFQLVGYSESVICWFLGQGPALLYKQFLMAIYSDWIGRPEHGHKCVSSMTIPRNIIILFDIHLEQTATK